MSATKTGEERPAILSVPAVARRDWLPVGEWDELDEYHAEHVRLLDLAAEIAASQQALREQFAEEDRAYEASVAAEVRGEDAEEVDLTPPAEREAALAPGTARHREVIKALAAHAEAVLAGFEEHADEWVSDLDAQDQEVIAEMAELRQQLARLNSQLTDRQRLRYWVLRQAGRGRTMSGALRARLIPFPDVPTPPAEDRLDPRVPTGDLGA